MKSNLNILIAEENDIDLEFFTRSINKINMKFNIYRVNNGSDLIRVLKKDEDFKLYPIPDIIFLDNKMPKKTGLEALREIKSDNTICHIPIIMLSTSNNRDDILNCYKNSVNLYIEKPRTEQKYDEFMVCFEQLCNNIAIPCS